MPAALSQDFSGCFATSTSPGGWGRVAAVLSPLLWDLLWDSQGKDGVQPTRPSKARWCPLRLELLTRAMPSPPCTGDSLPPFPTCPFWKIVTLPLFLIQNPDSSPS